MFIGKIDASNAGPAIENLITLLRIGGMAVLIPPLHLPIVQNGTITIYDSKVDSSTPAVVVKTVHMVLDSKRHYTMFVIVNSKRAGVVVKRCDPGYYPSSTSSGRRRATSSKYNAAWGCFAEDTKLSEDDRRDVTSFFKGIPEKELNRYLDQKVKKKFDKLMENMNFDVLKLPIDENRIFHREQYEYAYLQSKAFGKWLAKFSDIESEYNV